MPDVPLLQVCGLDAAYGDVQVLFGVSVEVAAGQVIAVIGANGAGKSTLLGSVAGLMRSAAGAIRLGGRPVGDMAAHLRVAQGVALVPEGRRLFASLTVEENLVIGGRVGRPGPWSLARIYRLFPVLAERRRMPATALSGGQQQMAAIGRALMSNPALLLCDEISLGLAPVVVRDIYAQMGVIRDEGTAIVVVEQDIGQALGASDRAYCLRQGRVVLAGASAGLTREAISQAYFGV